MVRAAAKRKPRAEAQPGYDGAEFFDAEVRLTHSRSDRRIMRARPGSFEWRYARPSAETALYHAGSRFAVLWEKAGTADAHSIDYSREGHGSGWKGLPEGRMAALDEVKQVSRELGKLSSRRLTLYCVQGMTTGEIADQFGVSDRAMAAVLHEDLRAAAFHFRFL